MNTRWETYTDWTSLWSDARILARVWPPKSEGWMVVMYDGNSLPQTNPVGQVIPLDPNLTLDEVKQIVQTLVGSQT